MPARRSPPDRGARRRQRRAPRPLRGRAEDRSRGVGLNMSGAEQNKDVTPPVDEVPVDELDRKLLDAFAGRVVRTDLVKKLKVGFNIPVYVLEYLLGKFCSTANRDEIE